MTRFLESAGTEVVVAEAFLRKPVKRNVPTPRIARILKRSR